MHDANERAAAREAWRAARSFADLCSLASRFLAGELPHFPGWGAPDLDEESDTLVPLLVACARRGLLTTASQPGRPFAPDFDGRPRAQRAFVAGFAAPADAAAWAEGARAAGLLAHAHASDATGGPRVPAALRDGVPYLFAGGAVAAEERALFADDLRAAGRAALADRAFLWLVEPSWGRRDRFERVVGRLVGE